MRLSDSECKKMDGLMKGIIKTGVIFSIVLVAAVALFYVLPVLADATVTATVTNATVNTRANVSVLNFTITASGNSSLANITINITESGFTGLLAGNIVCPNATDAGQGTPWNASVAGNGEQATCFRNHTTQNLTGTIRMAIKGLSAPVAARSANFTINVTDDIDRTNITTVSVTVKLLEANATVNVASVNAGARQNYTFTVINNGTDTIDRINISYASSWPDPDALSSILCPTTTFLWNRSVDNSTNNIVCTVSDPLNDPGISEGVSKTIKVENWSAPADARVKIFDFNVRGLSGGNFTIAGVRPSTSVFGNLSVTGTNRAASVNQTSTANLTMISFNFSITGEQMNISEIIVTRNGTVENSDIIEVKLYNSTLPDAGPSYNTTEAYDIIAVNASAPTNGRYNFSGLSLRLNTTQTIIVVVNLSSTAVGGRTMNFSIEGAGDVATVGALSGQAITETLATQRSSTTTIFGTLSVTGTNRVNGTTNLGANTTTFVSYNFTAVGEQMNISEILFTINGTGVSSANVQSISLFNSTDKSTTIANGSQTLIRTNASSTNTPTSITYNLSGLNLSVPTGATGQIVLIALNISGAGTGGNSVNITVRNNADIVTVSSASGQNIAETLSTAGSSATRLFGNLTVVGGSRVNSTTQIGSKPITVITFNFTAAGEQMNVTGINITLNGTILIDDIDRVGLFNTSLPSAALVNGTGTWDLVGWNNSAPVNTDGNILRYNFSNIAFNVPSGSTNILAVVVNLTEAAKGGRIFNASIDGQAFVNTTGGGSAVAIFESITSQRSSSSTIYGNLSVTGTNIAPTAADIGQIGIGLLRLTLNATGERINVTSINVTYNGTSRTDVLAVRLFNDTGGATLGTYERNADQLVPGATGAFTGASLILTPTVPIQVENSTLVYIYVGVDVNTSAAIGADRLAVSIQGASAIVAVGNESLVSLTADLITGDPGGAADIINLTATSTVIVTSTAIARVEAGKSNNYTFTINNTGTGTSDTIDEIRIGYLDSGFTLAGNATCPTINSIAWNRSVLSANTIVCNVTDIGGRLPVDKNTTITVQNFTAGQTAGLQAFNITARGAVGGIFNITSVRPTVTVYGNLSFNGTNRLNSTVAINTTQFNGTGVTLISYNVTASGEAMNVSEIIVELNGTSISSADIQSISLFNSTDKSTTIANGSQTLIRTNVSATSTPTSLRYNLSGLNLSVPTGTTGQILLVTANISVGATGGRTINATIVSDADIVTIGSLTGVAITENRTNMNSSTATIFGNLTVVGTSRVASTRQIGSKNVTVISFNFTATGEQMNITGINVTLNGTFDVDDITEVRLFNSSAAAAGLLDGSGVNYDLISRNLSAPVTGSGSRFNFSNIGFNVSAGTTNVLLVVVNISSTATGGNTFNASIEGAADVVTTGGGSALAIVEHFTGQRSSSSTIFGNLTISGTSRVASQTRLGSSNVTIISFNLTAAGEQMNISEIIVTRNGTVGNEDIVSVALYNSTKDNAQTFNETGNIDPLAVNTSAPTNGRYNFSGLSLKVPTGNIGQIVMVVFNVSSSANAGRTLNASIEGAADVATIGSASGVAVTEDFATQRSATSTLVGMKITGTSRVGATTEIGATNVSVISFTFNASGEAMNVTGLNITFNGTITTADVVRVGLYNSTAANAGVYNETTYDLIQWNLSAPVAGGGNTLRYNFSNIAFNITSGTQNTLVVVVNVSSTATGGRTFNASIEGDADAIVTGVSSGLAITETYASQRSSTSTLLGNLTVTGTSRVAAYTRLGSSNVTVISYNFSTTGEQMNISEIIVTVNGSSISTADIVVVALYNSTKENAQTFNETGNIDPLAVNTSAPSAGAGSTLRYNFSGLSFRVPSSQILMVVLNVSSTATGGRTFNASIEAAGDIATIGGVSNTAIAETLATQRSGTSTLVSFNVSSVSVSPNNISANQSATAMLNITVTTAGETMNITSFNFTLTGNGTTGNVTDVRMFRDDAVPLGAFTDADTYLSARGTFNGNSLQLNLSATNYNLSVGASTIFFVTYNVSGGARSGATLGVQLTPSGIAAIGNASGLAISVTGNSVASANSTVQSEATLSFGSLTSSYAWITNKTTLVNTTNISIPVTNDGISTANLTSVLITFLAEANAQNASTNFTVVRADSVTSIAGGVTTALNFTVNATTGAQLVGRVNASVRLIYNDSNKLAAASASASETNTTGLFGVDGIVPTISIVNPVLGGNASGGQVDINFTLNDTGSGANRSAIAISINSVARNATCNGSGLNFTCNYSMFSSDSLFVFGSVTARITNVTDNATNSAGAAEINFTLNNNDGVANLTRPIVGADPYDLGWNTIQMPTQTMMEQQGRNASNTGSFNFTSLMTNLGTSWTHMYYNINGTSTGWVLATRTDFAGSTLKYLNNTNANPYWVNMTSRGMVFKI